MEFVEDQRTFNWDLSGLSNQAAGHDYAAVDSNNPFEARVTHSVSIRGKQTWAGPGATGTSTSAADNAMAWITGVYMGFGYDSYAFGHALSGWTNLTGSNYSTYDHFRTHTVNEVDGSVSLSETWVILGNNSGVSGDALKCTEDFNVSVRRSNSDGKVNISIDGQIQGYEDRTYSGSELNTNVTSGAYDHASALWATVQDRLFPRAQFIFQQDFSTLLNPEPVTKTIGHQPSRGIITYAYEYDDRPCAFITGALSDIFGQSMGAGEGLRWALVIVTLANVWAAIHYFRAARTLREDLAKAPV